MSVRVLFVGESCDWVTHLEWLAGWRFDVADLRNALGVYEPTCHALALLRLAGRGELTVRQASNLCGSLRSAASLVALIVVAQRELIVDRSWVFDAGADHVMSEPCSAQEILACVRALSRRVPQLAGGIVRSPHDGVPVRRVSGISSTRLVHGPGGNVVLTRTERCLLDTLIDAGPGGAPMEVLTKEFFSRTDRSAGNLVHRHIANLRKKLRVAGLDGVVVSIPGGYVARAERLTGSNPRRRIS